MRTHKERQFKRTARKWLGSSPTVTVILEDRWLRLVLLLCLLALCYAVVLTPDYWITTPKGMMPVRKISFLDMIAARQMNDRAQAQATAGNPRTAASTWRMARQRNPGNLAVLRGSTRNLLTMQDSLFENRIEALALAAWLVGASQTNYSDVVLAMRVFETFNAPEQIVLGTDPKPLREAQDLVATRFGALLRLGMAPQIREELKALPAPVKSNPDTQLFQSALSVLLDAPDAGVARDRLVAARQIPRDAALATRLWYRASLHQGDVTAAKDALRQLVEARRNELQDHLMLWRLLLKKGDPIGAAKLADEKVPNPLTGAEAFHLASTLAEVGRVDLATQVLQREIPKHIQSLRLWILQAEILARAKDWHALRAKAIQMRESLAQNRDATALSFLFEAQGCHELGITRDVVTSLGQMRQLPMTDPSLALYAGRMLQQIGAFEMVQAVLKPLQGKLEQNPEFWNLIFDAGFSAKSSGELLAAGRRAWELEPDKPEAMNRYAAALIVVREQPEKLLVITRLLKAQFPKATGATLNLAQALIFNSRLQEAAQLLREIDDRHLTGAERNPYWLASTELAILQNDAAKATQCLSRLQTDDLFPEQAKWLEEARKTLPR